MLALAVLLPFLGRWDLSVRPSDFPAHAAWLEVTETEMRMVGRGGAVRPVTTYEYEDGTLKFTVKDWYVANVPVEYELTRWNDRINGVARRPNAKPMQVSGLRAPVLKRTPPSVWGDATKLFNERDLTGWIPDKTPENLWRAENGELVNTGRGANIRTAAEFDDFQLKLEFNVSPDSNSGVYLRGRYEIQIEDAKLASPPLLSTGSIYGFLAPSVNAQRPAGEWQTLDAMIAGRQVTVKLNGQTVIDRQDIPGPTGGALDANESRGGPIYLQGDHGAIRFRNIVLTPAARR